MSQRAVAVLVLVAAVAAAGYVVTREDAPPGPGGGSPVEAAERELDPGEHVTAEPPGSAGLIDTTAGAGRVDVDASQAEPVEVAGTQPANRPTLRVEVRDALGQPVARVPVAITLRRRDLRGAKWHSIWSQESDADGMASVTDLPELVATRQQRVGAGGEPIEVVLLTTLPMRDPPTVALDLDALPAEPIVLTLPASGSVEVLLEHSNPNQLDRARVSIRDRDRPRDGLHSERVRGHTDQAGRIVFDRVGLGLRLGVEAVLDSGNVDAETEFDGPVAPGQRVQVRLAMVSDTPVLVAELRDEAGELIRDARLDLKMHAKHEGSSSSRSFNSKSDDAGQLVLELGDGYPAAAERSLQIHFPGDVVRSVRVTVPPVHAGENDLGVLILLPPPIICAGVVRDSDGQPVANARVEVKAKQQWGDQPENFYWDVLDTPHVRTDDSGEFTLAGIVDERVRAVTIAASGFLPLENHVVPVGAAGLVFVLERGAVLVGRLLFAERYPSQSFLVDVLDAQTMQGRESTSPSRDGKFKFGELRSGRVVVTARAFGFAESLWTSEPLDLVAGESRDLGEIDLRDSLHTIEFRVVDADGQPVHDARAVITTTDADQTQFEGFFLDAGRGKVIGPFESVDLLVYAPTHRMTRFYAVRDGQDLAMHARRQVRVSLPAGLEIPAGVTLRGSLEPVAPDRRARTRVELRSVGQTSTMHGSIPWLQGQAFEFTNLRYVDVAIGGAGSYRAQCTLELRGAETKSQKIDLDAASAIEIDDGFGLEEVALPLTQQAVDAAAAQLR